MTATATPAHVPAVDQPRHPLPALAEQDDRARIARA